MQNVSEQIFLIFFCVFRILRYRFEEFVQKSSFLFFIWVWSWPECGRTLRLRPRWNFSKKENQSNQDVLYMVRREITCSFRKKMYQGMKINFRLFRGFLVPSKGVRGTPKWMWPRMNKKKIFIFFSKRGWKTLQSYFFAFLRFALVFFYMTLNFDRKVRSIKIDKTTGGTLILFSRNFFIIFFRISDSL